MALTGRTIALAEGRQLEDLAGMLEKEGATVLRCPMLSILDTPDVPAVGAWLRQLILGKFEYVILFTGEGFRRLLTFAERGSVHAEAVEAFRKTKTITRGPKPAQALKEHGFVPTMSAAAPTTDGIITTLKTLPLDGVNVGVQLYSESNPPLIEFLTSAGAIPHPVSPYYYAPASDADHVVNLIRTMADGKTDAIVFTSSPQVDRLFEVASEQHLEEPLLRGFERSKVASVGPLVTERLRGKGVRVDIQPEQGFQMKNLVQHIKRAMDG